MAERTNDQNKKLLKFGDTCLKGQLVERTTVRSIIYRKDHCSQLRLVAGVFSLEDKEGLWSETTTCRIKYFPNEQLFELTISGPNFRKVNLDESTINRKNHWTEAQFTESITF